MRDENRKITDAIEQCSQRKLKKLAGVYFEKHSRRNGRLSGREDFERCSGRKRMPTNIRCITRWWWESLRVEIMLFETLLKAPKTIETTESTVERLGSCQEDVVFELAR